MKNLGYRLKKARNEKRLTQMEVAKIIGISHGTLSGYEREYRDPDTETLSKLSNLYDVSLDWLLTGEENKDNSHTPNDSTVFSNRLKKQRKEMKFSINELAEKVNLTPHTIERFEDGRGDVPGQRTLDKLSSVLGVTRDYLLGYTNDPKGYGVGTYDTDPKNLKAFIENNRSLGFDGDELELDEEEQEELLRHTRLAWMMIKEKRQEKAKKRK